MNLMGYTAGKVSQQINYLSQGFLSQKKDGKENIANIVDMKNKEKAVSKKFEEILTN